LINLNSANEIRGKPRSLAINVRTSGEAHLAEYDWGLDHFGAVKEMQFALWARNIIEQVSHGRHFEKNLVRDS